MSSISAFLLFLAPLVGAPVPIAARNGYEENKGQFPPNVLYALRSSAYLTTNALVLAPEQVSIQFEGGNPAPPVLPTDTLPYLANVFFSADSRKWITGIHRFGQVQYSAVYHNIDLSFTTDPFFTFRFTIGPGADGSAIRLNFTGALVTEAPPPTVAQLQIWLPGGRIGLNSTAYQDTPAGRVPVKISFSSLGPNRFGFTLAAHDATIRVAIESSFGAGGLSNLEGPQIVSHSGAMYGMSADFAMVTSSAPYQGATAPVAEVCGLTPMNSPWPCREVAIYKYSPAGDLIYVSYLRGTADQTPSAIAVDDTDAVYVTGETDSSDFPVTTGASQQSYAGPPASFTIGNRDVLGDVFVAKLDSAGKLLYSTYVGGPNADAATGIQLDSSGNAYVGGPSSAALPVTSGVFQSTPCNVALPATGNAPPTPCTLGYIAKVNPTGRVTFLTYLPDEPSKYTVDALGNIYFAGSKLAPPGSVKQAFVAKLNASGSSLLYSTNYNAFGATGVDSIAVDSQGDAWLSGSYPGDAQTSWVDGYPHSFLAKISSDGLKVVYQTPFIGGQLSVNADDSLSSFTQGYGSQVVRTPNGIVTSACAPATISLLDPNGIVLLNRPVNPVYLNFNSYAPGAFEPFPLIPTSPDSSCMLNAPSLSNPNSVAPGEIVTIFGRGLGPAKGIQFTLEQNGRVPNSLGGVQVMFDGVPAPILYADDGQVNLIAPFSLRSGSAVSIQVQYQGRTTPTITASVTSTAPALFSLDASGSGQVLAFNQDGTMNNAANPAHLGSIITVFATGTGVTMPASIEGAVATSIDAKAVTQSSVILGGANGGIPTQILYAGPSPGSLTSVTQLNLRLPASLASAISTFPLSQWPILFYNGGINQYTTIALSP